MLNRIPYEQIAELLMSERANRILLCILAGDIVYYIIYRHPYCWIVGVMAMIWLLWSLGVILRQYWLQHRKEQRIEKESLLKHQAKEIRLKGYAADAYQCLNESNQRLLCYAALTGQKSQAYNDVYLFDLTKDPIVGCLSNLYDVHEVHNPSISFTSYSNQGLKISFVIRKELEAVVREEIQKNNYTIENTREYLNRNFRINTV